MDNSSDFEKRFENWQNMRDELLEWVKKFLDFSEETFFTQTGAFSKETVTIDLQALKTRDIISGGNINYLYQKKQVYYSNIADFLDMLTNKLLPNLKTFDPTNPYVTRLEDCLEHIWVLKRLVENF